MKELISIIIPAYNVRECIGRCLDSVLAQTYDQYEVIIIEDGSTDGTADILQAYAEKNNSLRIYYSMHAGVSAARNKGLEVAKGRYIAFVDADDEIAPAYLEKLYGLIKAKDAQIAVCGICHVNSAEGCRMTSVGSKKDRSRSKVMTGKAFLSRMEEPLRYEKTAVCWNKLYKRELFEQAHYPEGRIYEDSAIMQDILYPVKRLAETEEVLYFYHTETVGITRSAYSIDKTDEVLYAKKRMIFFRQKREPELYRLARKQYGIVLLKHYYLLKKSKVANKKMLLRLREEQKKYLKGLGWKKKLPFQVGLVFEAGRYLPYLCGGLIVWWDTFLEKRYRNQA